ncbi:MAG: DinB family protein [Pirellulales bacterium]
MREVELIAKQIERTFSGPAWHGPSVEQVLQGVDAKTACAASPGGDHTLWQIVDHMAFWEAAVLRWLSGELVQPKDEDSWSAVSDASEAAWQATLAQLRRGHQQLLDVVRSLDDGRLKEKLFDDMPSVYGILHGVAQHNVYHAGQIALLKKIGRK